MARIDSPRLKWEYLNQLVEFRAAQLVEFNNRSEQLQPTCSVRRARVRCVAQITFAPLHDRHSHWSMGPMSIAMISCQHLYGRVSHTAQVLGQFSTILSDVAHLEIDWNE